MQAILNRAGGGPGGGVSLVTHWFTMLQCNGATEKHAEKNKPIGGGA